MFTKILCVLSLAFAFHCQLSTAAEDALDEVNRLRASRGLPAFARDEALSQAAARCADHRAAHLIQGHSSNDFGFLPGGSRAGASGCAAWPAHMGWGSCCSHERWTYGGAAYAVGRDGRRYMQLFVSNSPNGQTFPTTQQPPLAGQTVTTIPQQVTTQQYYTPQTNVVPSYTRSNRRWR